MEGMEVPTVPVAGPGAVCDACTRALGLPVYVARADAERHAAAHADTGAVAATHATAVGDP